MAKQKLHKTNTDKKKSKKYTISSEKLRKMEKAAERQVLIELGIKDPAFQGGGRHGGTEEAQTRRKRKADKKALNKYRNQGTRNLED